MYLEEINAIQLFINFIKSVLTGQALSADMVAQVTPEVLPKVLQIAAKQDQLHMVAYAMKKHGLLGTDEASAGLASNLRFTLYRHEMLMHEQNAIFQALEEAGVDYVPLKGAVIRDLYPEAWMRTSSDVDILVREEALSQAKDALVSKLGYRVTKNNFHDVALVSPQGLLLELHFKITENEEKMDRMLEKVWEYVSRTEAESHRMEMTKEYLIFHSYAHMLYHFINGGCGIRYVIDIWILEQKLDFDAAKLEKLLEACEMSAFASYARKLARVWFEGEAHDHETSLMEMYIIEAGLFGNVESKVKARKVKAEGKGEYLLQRVFIPYKEFCSSYPILSKYPVLYPYYTVKRWFKIFDRRKAEQAILEIQLNQEMKQESVQKLRELFEKLNL